MGKTDRDTRELISLCPEEACWAIMDDPGESVHRVHRILAWGIFKDASGVTEMIGLVYDKNAKRTRPVDELYGFMYYKKGML